MADLAGINGQRENFRVVGKRNLPGILSYTLATGTAKFGIDYVLPDMLHAKFLRSPYANAKVLSVDTTKAKYPALWISSIEDEDIINLIGYGEHWGSQGRFSTILPIRRARKSPSSSSRRRRTSARGKALDVEWKSCHTS